jgi:aspartyl-tRNA(Asn)/glutamyl-tRNA(Gln) amidotransferase subunit B
MELISKTMNELPDERIKRFIKEYSINKDASYALIYTDKNLADFFENCAKKIKDYTFLANWTLTYLLKCLNYNNTGIKNSKISPELFIEFIDSMISKKVTERLGKELIKDLVDSKKSIYQIMKDKKLSGVKNEDLLIAAKKALLKNEKAVNDYKSGNNNSLNYLIGQVLRELKFQAKVEDVRETLQDEIKKNY